MPREGQSNRRQDDERKVDDRAGHRYEQVDFRLVGHARRDKPAHRPHDDHVDLAADAEGGQRVGRFMQQQAA